MSKYKIVTAAEANKLPAGSVVINLEPGAAAVTKFDFGWSHGNILSYDKYRVLYVPPPTPPKVGDVLNEVTTELLNDLPIHTVLMDVDNNVVVKRPSARWSLTDCEWERNVNHLIDNNYLGLPVRVIYMPDQLDGVGTDGYTDAVFRAASNAVAHCFAKNAEVTPTRSREFYNEIAHQVLMAIQMQTGDTDE